MGRPLLPVVVMAVLPLATGCQVAVCSAAGADSGVGFEDIDNAFPNYHTRYEVRACAGDECADWVGDRRDATRLWVPLDDLTGPTAVTATLMLTSLVDPAEVVFDASTSVDLVRFQPNGPGVCPRSTRAGSRSRPPATWRPRLRPANRTPPDLGVRARTR